MLGSGLSNILDVIRGLPGAAADGVIAGFGKGSGEGSAFEAAFQQAVRMEVQIPLGADDSSGIPVDGRLLSGGNALPLDGSELPSVEPLIDELTTALLATEEARSLATMDSESTGDGRLDMEALKNLIAIARGETPADIDVNGNSARETSQASDRVMRGALQASTSSVVGLDDNPESSLASQRLQMDTLAAATRTQADSAAVAARMQEVSREVRLQAQRDSDVAIGAYSPRANLNAAGPSTGDDVSTFVDAVNQRGATTVAGEPAISAGSVTGQSGAARANSRPLSTAASENVAADPDALFDLPEGEPLLNRSGIQRADRLAAEHEWVAMQRPAADSVSRAMPSDTTAPVVVDQQRGSQAAPLAATRNPLDSLDKDPVKRTASTTTRDSAALNESVDPFEKFNRPTSGSSPAGAATAAEVAARAAKSVELETREQPNSAGLESVALDEDALEALRGGINDGREQPKAAPPRGPEPAISSGFSSVSASSMSVARASSNPSAEPNSFLDALEQAPDDPEFPQALLSRVRLIHSNGQREARLNLHPAELGRLTINVSTEGDATRVAFTVDNPQARDAIELAMPRLRELLGEAGLQLADSSVSEQNQGGSDAREGSSAEAARPAGSIAETEPAETDNDTGARPGASTSLLDAYA